jgi:hypothetical protein
MRIRRIWRDRFVTIRFKMFNEMRTFWDNPEWEETSTSSFIASQSQSHGSRKVSQFFTFFFDAVVTSPLSIWRPWECSEHYTTVCENTACFKPKSIPFGRLHRVSVKINSIFHRGSPFIGNRAFKVRMDLQSISVDLAMKHLEAIKIHAQMN